MMCNRSGSNICFDCRNAVPDNKGHGCSWSIKFEPVPGWTAIPVKQRAPERQKAIETYFISDCPQFDPDEREKDKEHPPVAVRCIETGEVYESIQKAGRAVGKDGYGISSALRNGRNYAYGLHWERVK